MTDKSKRKGNPRRQVLWKFATVFGVLLISYFSIIKMLENKSQYYIVYPKVTEIFVQQLTRFDINEPENEKQLTFHESGVYPDAYDVSGNGEVMVYIRSVQIDTVSQGHLFRHDLKTGEIVSFGECACSDYHLNIDGTKILYRRWIGYGETSRFELTVLDFDSESRTVIDDGYFGVPNSIVYWTKDDSIRIIYKPYNKQQSNIAIFEYASATFEKSAINFAPSVEEYVILGWDYEGNIILQHIMPDSEAIISIDTSTNEIETWVSLPSNSFVSSVEISPDNALLLYFYYSQPTGQAQYILHNLVTNEQQSLPHLGGNPMWVSR